MRVTDAACRRCAAVTPAGEARKAMIAGGVAFLGKSMRPRCPRCGNTSIPSARHCTSCGSALLSVVKSAAQVSRNRYMSQMLAEPDPATREVLWQAANPDLYGNRGAS
jgi:ribosomal protein L37E